MDIKNYLALVARFDIVLSGCIPLLSTENPVCNWPGGFNSRPFSPTPKIIVDSHTSVTLHCYRNGMYNKLFNKILDSSIWLENQPTRLVWITFIACMDQDGTVALSSIGNVANRARVSDSEAAEAIHCLESPDVYNPDQENEGRRIERVPGVGWIVINAPKYRDIVKAETVRAQTRERVRRFRGKSCNADVTHDNENVTPSVSVSEAKNKTPLPPLGNPSPSAQEKNELDNYSAAKSLGELIGYTRTNNLIRALEQAKRRWPEKRMEQIVLDIVALWKEYRAQGHHAPVAIHNWLDGIGTYIDSDDWKKKPKEAETKSHNGVKPARKTPEWAFTKPQ